MQSAFRFATHAKEMTLALQRVWLNTYKREFLSRFLEPRQHVPGLAPDVWIGEGGTPQ